MVSTYLKRCALFAMILIIMQIPRQSLASQYNKERMGDYLITGIGEVELDNRGDTTLRVSSSQGLIIEMAEGVQSTSCDIDLYLEENESEITLKDLNILGLVLIQSSTTQKNTKIDITLENVQINNGRAGIAGSPLIIHSSDINLKLIGNNKITNHINSEYGLSSSGRMNILGSGTLKINGGLYGICAGTLTINGGKTETLGTDDGVFCGGDFVIKSGELVTEGGEYGIRTPLNIVVEGGKVIARGGISGLYSYGRNLKIVDGEVQSTGGQNGIETHLGTIIHGGKNEIEGNAHGIHADSIEITGGESIIKGRALALHLPDYHTPALPFAIASISYDGITPQVFNIRDNRMYKWIAIGLKMPTPTPTPNIGDIIGGEDDFGNLPPVDVPTLILPDGVVMDASAILQYDKPNANKKNTVVYNVHLINQNGEALDLPAGAILCFPYPEGLDENSGNKYRIIIHHYADNGSTEVFKSENGDIEFTKQGLCIRVSSFSPFEITWEEQPEVDLPQTGDNSHIALWLVLLTVAGAMMLTLKRKTA